MTARSAAVRLMLALVTDCVFPRSSMVLFLSGFAYHMALGVEKLLVGACRPWERRDCHEVGLAPPWLCVALP